jgi:hypothetical protein
MRRVGNALTGKAGYSLDNRGRRGSDGVRPHDSADDAVGRVNARTSCAARCLDVYGDPRDRLTFRPSVQHRRERR